MHHKYIGIKYMLEFKEVVDIEVYDNPMFLGDRVFVYCVSKKDGTGLVVSKDYIFDTIEECWAARFAVKKWMEGIINTKSNIGGVFPLSDSIETLKETARGLKSIK